MTSHVNPDEALGELIRAVDYLARAGDFDRGRVARGLAALVVRRASFEALRMRFDARFGERPHPAFNAHPSENE
jgi:hypothetical protein